MNYLAIAIVALAIAVIAIRQWRKFRAFRGEVIVECLSLWREQITDYYRRHPDLKPVTSISEEAMYAAMHSEHRQDMYSKAWVNVKRNGGKSSEPSLAMDEPPVNPSSKKRSSALEKFSKEIESWPEEQARTALLLIKAGVDGNQDQINELHRELTVGQFKAVVHVMREMEKGN